MTQAQAKEPIDLIKEIRSHRSRQVRAGSEAGKVGLALRILFKELYQRVTSTELLLQLTMERERGAILIVGKKLFQNRKEPQRIIECALDSGVFEERWKRSISGGEEFYVNIRVYVRVDGVPATFARQTHFKRWQERHP